MKIFIKKISIVLLFILLCTSVFNNPVKAVQPKMLKVDEVLSTKLASSGGGDGYDSQMKDLINSEWTDKTDASNKATNVLTTMVVVVKVVAVAIAIIMLLAVAMKYMTAAPGEKAEIKKHAVVYVVGAVVLFAATGILSLIEGFAKVFSSGSEGAST